MSESSSMPMVSLSMAEVLTLATGRLMLTEGIGGLYTALQRVTGEAPFSHQLTRFLRESGEHVKKHIPLELAEVEIPADVKGADACREYVDTLVRYFKRDTFDVPRMLPDDHSWRDAEQEAADIFGRDRVINIVTPSPPPSPSA